MKNLSKIISVGLLSLQLAFHAQIPCGEGLVNPASPVSSPQRVGPCATDVFSGNTAKYNQQSFYKVTPNNGNTYWDSIPEPMITVKLVFHIFFRTSISTNPSLASYGYGQWQDIQGGHTNPNINDTLLQAYINNLEQQTWVSQPRLCSQADGVIVPNNYDTRIRYEVENVYFYHDNSAWENSFLAGQSLETNYPNRLKEGLPVLFTLAAYGSQGFLGDGPALFLGLGRPGSYSGMDFSHVKHELNHCFGLLHTYFADPDPTNNATCFCYNPNNFGCGPASEPEHHKTNSTVGHYLDCSDPEYLSDVFPINNSYASLCSYPNLTVNYPIVTSPWFGSQACYNPPVNSCSSVYESDPFCTNNQMSDNGVFYPRNWLSPLQVGRKRKYLHINFPSGISVRQFAKDMESEYRYPWQITNDEEWNFDIQMYEDIVVKAGNTLTIKCGVAMARNGRIIVEKNARLIVDGGEITGWCKKGLWRGIEIEGTQNQPQSLNSTTGLDINQGAVMVINGGKISHAKHAIYAGRTTPGTNLHVSGSEGGIVILNDANLLNNQYDVLLFNHSNFAVETSIINSNFKTTGVIGLDISSGLPIPPAEHIKVFNTTAEIFGCTFEYAAGTTYPNNHGFGIFSSNSVTYVDHSCPNGINAGPCPTTERRSLFKNLEVGVYLENTNPLFPGTVTRSTFEESTKYALVNHNTLLMKFRANIVKGNGIYMHKAKMYNIQDNYFTSLPSGPFAVTYSEPGVIAYDSKTSVHNVYANEFNGLNVGICALDENAGNGTATSPSNPSEGLKMNCNDFISIGNQNLQDIVVTVSLATKPYIMVNQGTPFTPPNSDGLVRNFYNAQWLSLENKYAIDAVSTQQINHRVGTNSTSEDPSDPFPVQASSKLSILYTSILWNYISSCKTNPLYMGGSGSSKEELISNLDDYIYTLKSDNENDKNHAEIQSSVASKLELFLKNTDSTDLGAAMQILRSNEGNMIDSDILMVYGFLREKRYDSAMIYISALDTIWNDYADLLEKVVYYEQHDTTLNATDLTFLEDYVSQETKVGQGTAQSLLKWKTGTAYELPIATLLSARPASQPKITGLNAKGRDETVVFPNPTNDLLYIKGLPGALEYQFIIRDLLGREIINKLIKFDNIIPVDVESLIPGMYILTCQRTNGELLFESKINKE